VISRNQLHPLNPLNPLQEVQALLEIVQWLFKKRLITLSLLEEKVERIRLESQDANNYFNNK
jgi:hypothetical protein